MKSLLAKILILSVLLTSCARRTAFTKTMKDEGEFSDLQLSKIQFYISDAILLYESKADSKIHIVDGKIIQNSLTESEMIVIKENTPGILTRLDKQNNLGISFETADGKVLMFTILGDTYNLAADEWTGGIGKLQYGDKTYYTDAGHVYLTVKVKEFKYAKSKQRTLSGRTL